MPMSSPAWVLSVFVCVSGSCDHMCMLSEYNARQQDKFLFSADTLSSRQLNTVKALVRLGSEAKIRPKVPTQITHLQFLTNCEVTPWGRGYVVMLWMQASCWNTQHSLNCHRSWMWTVS